MVSIDEFLPPKYDGRQGQPHPEPAVPSAPSESFLFEDKVSKRSKNQYHVAPPPTAAAAVWEEMDPQLAALPAAAIWAERDPNLAARGRDFTGLDFHVAPSIPSPDRDEDTVTLPPPFAPGRESHRQHHNPEIAGPPTCDHVHISTFHVNDLTVSSMLLWPGKSRSDIEKSRIMAAGVAAMVVGTTFFGFMPGVILFGSTYYAAARHPPGTMGGDLARALGDVALFTSAKAQELNRQHQLVGKAKQTINDIWEHAKALDREHHILERIRIFAIVSLNEALEFSRRRRLLEKGMAFVGACLRHLVSSGRIPLEGQIDRAPDNTVGPPRPLPPPIPSSNPITMTRMTSPAQTY